MDATSSPHQPESDYGRVPDQHLEHGCYSLSLSFCLSLCLSLSLFRAPRLKSLALQSGMPQGIDCLVPLSPAPMRRGAGWASRHPSHAPERCHAGGHRCSRAALCRLALAIGTASAASAPSPAPRWPGNLPRSPSGWPRGWATGQPGGREAGRLIA